MIKLFKNAQVYAPAPLGKKDLLIVDEKICRIAEKITGYEGLPDVETFDLEGKILTPGYIDLHVHITGECSATLDYFSELEDAEINNEANEELLRMILEENHP